MFEFTSMNTEVNINTLNLAEFNNIKFTNILFRYSGRSPIFKDVSFEVKKGQIIAFIGESGSGKSTLMQILAKNYDIESGNIIVNDKTFLNSISFDSWRGIIGLVPQKPYIFSGTILENIAFDDVTLNPNKVLRFLIEYGFEEFINSLPHSYNTIVGEEGINLSGGQIQMIALARTLYHKPQLLILDEATASMDRSSEQFVLNLLEKIKMSVGIIFITHRLHILKNFCDNIYIIDENGTTVINGKHDDLLKSINIYSNYWYDLIT